MALKDIVLHQGPDSRSGARLNAAAGLAKTHKARVVGIFVKSDPKVPEYTWGAFGKEGLARWRAQLEQAASEAETAFKARMKKDELASDWIVIESDPTDTMMHAARFADLAVIGQTDPDQPSYENLVPDHVLLGAGGPVLVVPYVGDYAKVGKRAMIAWNGTREAARAVRDALPLLQKSTKVIVYNVNPGAEGHQGIEDICTHLKRHGVKAETGQVALGSEAEAVDPSLSTVGGYGFQQVGAWTRSRHTAVSESSVSDALLSAVSDHATDLLVMGAYGRSRVWELVLGGVTRQILKTMTVPVLMSN